MLKVEEIERKAVKAYSGRAFSNRWTVHIWLWGIYLMRATYGQFHGVIVIFLIERIYVFY